MIEDATAIAKGNPAMAQLLAADKTQSLEFALQDLRSLLDKTGAASGGIQGVDANAFLSRARKLYAGDSFMQYALPPAEFTRLMAPFVEMAAEQKQYKSNIGTLALPGMLSQLGGFTGYQAGGLPGALLGAGVGLATYAAARGQQSQRALSNPAARASLLQNLRAQAPKGAAWKTAIPLQVLAQSPEVILRSLNQGQAAPGLLPSEEEERLRQP